MLVGTAPFRDFDRLTQQVWGTTARPAAMPMDAWRDGEQIVVQFDLPGVDLDSVDLDVERNMLTVRAERYGSTDEDTKMIAAERPRGVLRRQLILGDTPDTDRVEASYARSEPTRSSKSSTPAGATSSLLFATAELIQTGGPRGRGDRSRASRRRPAGSPAAGGDRGSTNRWLSTVGGLSTSPAGRLWQASATRLASPAGCAMLVNERAR